MPKTEGGGSRRIEIKATIDYTFDSFKRDLIDNYTNDQNKDYFADGDVVIEDKHKNGFTDFINKNGEKCDFKAFCSSRLKDNGRNYIVLATHENRDTSLTHGTDDSSGSSSDSKVSSIKTNSRPETNLKPENTGNHQNISNFHSPIAPLESPRHSTNALLPNVTGNSFRSNFTRESDSSDKNCFHMMTSLNENAVNVQIQQLRNMKLNVAILEHISAITFLDTLGEGAQGIVRKALWKGIDVAVKSMRHFSKNEENQILREIGLLDKIRISNFIQILAVCPQARNYHIVTEFCDGDSLHHVLHSTTAIRYNLTRSIKDKICRDICIGIRYLHTFESGPILHRDIKPINVILSRDYQVKICDLGIGKCNNIFNTDLRTMGLNNVKGTIPYMAPEIINGEEATTYSDIWALACTIVEIYTGKILWDVKSIMEITIQFYKKTTPDLAKLSVPVTSIEILNECFDYLPTGRPSSGKLLDFFKKLVSEKR